MPDTPPIWFQQEGESNRLYSIFDRFRLAGPGRSLLGIYAEEQASKGRKRPDDVPGSLKEAAARWRWRERAEAFDQAERDRLRQVRADLFTGAVDRFAELLDKAAVKLGLLIDSGNEGIALRAAKATVELALSIREQIDIDERLSVLEQQAKALQQQTDESGDEWPSYGGGHA